MALSLSRKGLGDRRAASRHANMEIPALDPCIRASLGEEQVQVQDTAAPGAPSPHFTLKPTLETIPWIYFLFKS